jgi:hypothetical protein
VRRTNKNDIIHVNLKKEKVIVMFQSRERLIYTSLRIPML